MKTAGYLIGAVLGLAGIISLLAATQGHAAARAITGIVLLAAAAFMIYLARSKGPETKVTHKVDFTGDTELQQLQCKSCGAQLTSDALQMKEGAIYVKCPYCGTEYQLEEKPKW
jgi:DNA-directed RNA polymerase subunit RPC12/RpoP